MNTAASSMPLPIFDLPGDQHQRGLGILTVTKAVGRVALPLAQIGIAARVADRIASVTVTERFRNPYQEHLEAVYIFPLAGGAAVSDFVMKVGGRVIKGKVEERAAARRQYQQAIDEGKRAALLEKERDDVFTVQVGNLPPGEEITVEISYSERLPFFDDGNTELRLPLVVAPRYIPGQPLERDPVGEGIEDDTDIVPDASRITPPRLAKGFDPKVGLSIEVELMRSGADASEGDIRELCCSQHATRASSGSNSVKIMLARDDEPIDRDFVLRWALAGNAVKPTLLIYKDGDGAAYGMLSIAPPQRDKVQDSPRDVVFVVDRSGSMEGVKMASAARACALLLATLGPRDRFAIQAFDNVAEWLQPDKMAFARDYFLAADAAGIEKGEKYLREINSRGGTELNIAMVEALAAIKDRKQTDGRMPVVVLLTDGQIGDESRVLKQLQQSLDNSRVFTVGIDTAVNETFLRRLAQLGGGTATFVEPGAQLEEALRIVGREIGNPLVINVTLQDIDIGLEKASISPASIPDLFAGRATTAFFRAQGLGRVRVKGRFSNGGEFEAAVTAKEISLPAVAQLWAKARITDLEDQFRIDPQAQNDIKKEIIDLSIRHSLLTRFTAFVVVDESEIVNKDGARRKLVQPVEMPARWDMEMAAGKPAPPAPQMLSAHKPMSMPVGCPPPAPPPISCPAPATVPPPSQPVINDMLKTVSKTENMPMSRREAPGAAFGGRADKSGASSKDFKPAAEKEAYKAPANMQAEAPNEPGLISKALDAIAGIFGRDEANQASKQMSPITFFKDKVDIVKRAIAAFQAALAEIDAGRLPDAKAREQLERTRNILIGALLEAELETKLPRLYLLFNSEASALLAAIHSRNEALMKQDRERYRRSLNDALAEIAPYNKDGQIENDASFWESNI